MTQVIRCDGSQGIQLPSLNDRYVHLIAVAVGGRRQVPFSGGVKNYVYVHVLDEVALRAILGELDTAPDFIEYLIAKEEFSGHIECHGEEDLLALYLHRGRTLPDLDRLILDNNLWCAVQEKPEFKARKAEDRVSVLWDNLIELLCDKYGEQFETGPVLSSDETVVRTLAAENRFSRRFLSAAFKGWMELGKTGARTLVSPLTNVAFVFATFPRDWSRELRKRELRLRCFASRSPNVTGSRIVIGLGTEVYDPAGFSFDAVYLEKPDWTEEDEKVAEDIRAKLGLFQETNYVRATADEFPGSRRRIQRRPRQEGDEIAKSAGTVLSMKAFEAARRKYRPDRVRVAFIAESPPQEGTGRFFYFEEVDVGDSLFLELMKALYTDARASTKAVRRQKADYLQRFRDSGFYLIDASQEPIAGESRGRKAKSIRAGLDQLKRDLAEIQHDDLKVVLISSLVYEICCEPLREAGFDIVNTEMIDFPGFGRQRDFHTKFARIIDRL